MLDAFGRVLLVGHLMLPECQSTPQNRYHENLFDVLGLALVCLVGLTNLYQATVSKGNIKLILIGKSFNWYDMTYSIFQQVDDKLSM